MASKKITAADLRKKRCTTCNKSTPAMTKGEVNLLLGELNGWKSTGKKISRTFPFKNYHETIAFVNATAWVSHHENHHPDLEVGYNKCVVHYTTHDVGGLSENDFICAAKIDAITGAMTAE